MENHQLFFEFLNKFIHLTRPEYEDHFSPYIVIRKFEKKTIVTHAGEVENYFNFILKGLVRKYFKKGNHEINTQISFEGHIIHSQESFHSRTPSDYIVETLEPTIFLSMTFDDLEKLYASSKKMEHLGRMVVTASMVLKDRWQSQLVMLSPKERFIRFVSRHSNLLQRVPQKYLASYLNIKPETFSRFKHFIKDHSKKKESHLH
jgi:CRP-like cAMP-binding protein